eukprot:scaffold127_cov309-Prasinococcus_capsulatus_cf.AAC.2
MRPVLLLLQQATALLLVPAALPGQLALGGDACMRARCAAASAARRATCSSGAKVPTRVGQVPVCAHRSPSHSAGRRMQRPRPRAAERVHLHDVRATCAHAVAGPDVTPGSRRRASSILSGRAFGGPWPPSSPDRGGRGQQSRLLATLRSGVRVKMRSDATKGM